MALTLLTRSVSEGDDMRRFPLFSSLTLRVTEVKSVRLGGVRHFGIQTHGPASPVSDGSVMVTGPRWREFEFEQNRSESSPLVAGDPVRRAAGNSGPVKA